MHHWSFRWLLNIRSESCVPNVCVAYLRRWLLHVWSWPFARYLQRTRNCHPNNEWGTKSILSCHLRLCQCWVVIIMRVYNILSVNGCVFEKKGLTTGIRGIFRRATSTSRCRRWCVVTIFGHHSCATSRTVPVTRQIPEAEQQQQQHIHPFRVWLPLVPLSFRFSRGVFSDNNNNNDTPRHPDIIVLSLCVRQISGRQST